MNAGGSTPAAPTARARSSTCSSPSSSTTSCGPRRSAWSARCGKRASTPPIERREPWGVWGGELFANGKVLAQKRRRGRPPKVRPPEPVLEELVPRTTRRTASPRAPEHATRSPHRRVGATRPGYISPRYPSEPRPAAVNPVRYPRSPRAFSSVGESAALTRRRSGVRDPQRPPVVRITTFPQVRRHFACPIARIGSSLLSLLSKPRLRPSSGQSPALGECGDVMLFGARLRARRSSTRTVKPGGVLARGCFAG